MSSNAQGSLGFVFAINTGTVSTPVWTPVTDLTDLAQTATNKTADITTLASTAVETLVTLLDSGKVTLTLNRNSMDEGQAAIYASFTGKTKVQYKMTYPINTVAGQTMAGDTVAFYAVVDSFDGGGLSPAKQIISKVGLMITNGAVLTVGS